MIRSTLAVLAMATAGAVLAATAGAKTAQLKGEVGPGFKIEVEKGDKDLKTIKAGKYTIKVEDKSTIHNFHLIGPGLNKKTSVSFKGETTWKITLKPGRYTYQCDPHAAQGMKGHFTVKS
jgi:plastocyanin